MVANTLRLAEIHLLFTVALAAAFALAVSLAVFAGRRGASKGAPELAALMATVAWWCLAYFLEIVMPTTALKLLGVRLAYVAIAALPVLWLLLAARTSALVDLSRPGRILPIAAVPALTVAFDLAYPASRLLWADIRLDESLAWPMLAFTHGPWFTLNLAWSYALLLVGVVLVLASLRGAPRYYRGRAAAMIVAISAPWVLHGLFVFEAIREPPFSITPLIVAVSGIAAAWALLKRRFLDVMPFARDVVIGTMADPVLVLDGADRVVDANPAAQALFGAARQLVGASAADLVPGLPPVPGTPGRSRLGDQRLPAAPERWFEMDLADLPHDRRGRPAGRVVLLHETTERRRMEQTLRASEERFRSVVDTIDQVLFSLDREGRFTYVSPAVERMSRWKVSDIVGQPMERFVFPEDLPAVRRNVAGRYRGEREPHEFRVVNPDGSTLHVRTYSYPLMEDGEPAGISGIMTDITGQKQLQEQLQQSQKMEAVGRLAGGIAHDFSNLLTAITGFSEMLLLDGRVGAESRGWVAEIRRSIERGSSLVRQLLAFSRKRSPRLRSVDVNELIRGIERMLGRLIGEHLALRTSLADGLPPLCADPGQLELAIVNLAVNARDAMPGGGTLSIETAPAPGKGDRWIRLVIGDTGVGMDEHVRSHLFEPFFTTKEPGRGTGLGLSTVYGIVQQLGGTIAVESEPGRGTRVVIDLPGAEAPADRDAAEAPPPAPAGGTESLLVVEDDPLVRMTIQACLAPLGYRLTVATDGTEALAVDADAIDLLVTDVVMPGLSGGSLAGRLREARPDLPVLFVSGYEPGLLFPDGFPGGRSGFLQKPFTTADLARAVRSLLD